MVNNSEYRIIRHINSKRRAKTGEVYRNSLQGRETISFQWVRNQPREVDLKRMERAAKKENKENKENKDE